MITKYSNPTMITKVPDIFSACERHARQKRKNIKQAQTNILSLLPGLTLTSREKISGTK